MLTDYFVIIFWNKLAILMLFVSSCLKNIFKMYENLKALEIENLFMFEVNNL